MTQPTTIEQGCRRLGEEISATREEAHKAIGPMMLDGLVSQRLAWVKNGRYALTDAGRRAAEAFEPIDA